MFELLKYHTIMKLELKHLAAYLPYSINLQFTHGGQIGKLLSVVDAYDEDTVKIKIEGLDAEHIWMFKLVLHPMSRLNSYDIGNESSVWSTILSETDLYIHSDLDCELDADGRHTMMHPMPKVYDAYQVLLRNHFDVFGLIDAGLAIDVNSLTTP